MTTKPPRPPAVFELDTPGLDIAQPPAADTPADGEGTPRVVDDTARRAPARRWGWTGLFATGFGLLLSLAVGLAVADLIDALFARAPWLGYVGLAATALAATALVAIVIRDTIGLMRLGRIARLRMAAETAAETDDRGEARDVIAKVVALYQGDPGTARGRAELARHDGEIIDGRDLIKLAERALMARKDAEARGLILDAAKRVTAVTAISPRAVIDVLFVLFESLRLIRKLSTLYGGRPSGVGMIRLIRMVLGHLAVTGGIALTDSLVQQLLGHGLAARLSARLGEGVVNGLLTARIGLAALDVCRPLPYLAGKPPALKDIMNELMRFGEPSSK